MNNKINKKKEHNMSAMEIGKESKPRFEFRTFGQNFDYEHHLLSRLSQPVPEKVWERTSDEIYILSKTNDVNNTKLRDGKMDIKTFVTAKDGLEQWNPLMKGEFPIAKEVLLNEVFPAFKVEMPALTQDTYTTEEFLAMIEAHKDLAAVRVSKLRFGYMVNNTICEFAEVLINGAKICSVNSESTEIGDILKTMKDTGMDKFENLNYLQAIKRIIGWINKPLANEEF